MPNTAETWKFAPAYELPAWPFVEPPELVTGRTRRHPVVIAGGGLAGLTLACELAQRGIRAVLLDEDDTVGVRGASSRGICYAQKGFYEEAERCYKAASALQPDDVLLNYNVAALYALWEKPAQALPALKLALDKDPAKVRAWLSADPMFDELKNVPEFQQLVALQ